MSLALPYLLFHSRALSPPLYLPLSLCFPLSLSFSPLSFTLSLPPLSLSLSLSPFLSLSPSLLCNTTAMNTGLFRERGRGFIMGSCVMNSFIRNAIRKYKSTMHLILKSSIHSSFIRQYNLLLFLLLLYEGIHHNR